MYGNISRRDFLKNGFVFGGIVTGLPFFYPLKNEKSRFSKPVISVVTGDAEAAIRKAVDLLGGIRKYVFPGNTVLIKPNASFPSPSNWGATASPAAVKTVTHLTLEAGASRVIVADNTMRDGMVCFEKSGIMEELKNLDKVKIMTLDRDSFFEEIPVPKGKILKNVKIAKLVRRCDVFINLPCAKSHTATDVSFGLKNLMGVIRDRTYFHNTDIHTTIAELATVIKPDLTIIDASRALITGGPTGPGKVERLSTYIAGTDPLAVDSIAVTLTNWNKRMLRAESVKHLSHAAKLGVGEIDPDRISVKKTAV